MVAQIAGDRRLDTTRRGLMWRDRVLAWSTSTRRAGLATAGRARYLAHMLASVEHGLFVVLEVALTGCCGILGVSFGIWCMRMTRRERTTCAGTIESTGPGYDGGRSAMIRFPSSTGFRSFRQDLPWRSKLEVGDSIRVRYDAEQQWATISSQGSEWIVAALALFSGISSFAAMLGLLGVLHLD